VRYHMRPMQLNMQSGNWSARHDNSPHPKSLSEFGEGLENPSFSPSLNSERGTGDEVILSRRAVHRFWKATGEAGVGVCILTLADYLGMVGVTLVLQDWIHHLQIVDTLLDGYFNQKETVVAPPPLVSGHDLMLALKLEPGPRVGALLNAIAEAQAAGEITTLQEALTLAESMLNTLENDSI